MAPTHTDRKGINVRNVRSYRTCTAHNFMCTYSTMMKYNRTNGKFRNMCIGIDENYFFGCVCMKHTCCVAERIIIRHIEKLAMFY